jgi:hypothetical protein
MAEQMSHPAVVSSFAEPYVEKLARFFPGAIRVRIPVNVRAVNTLSVKGEKTQATENTVIEFGTENEVLFASTLGLEFEDKIHVQSGDGSLDIEAAVVAVQMNKGQLAVAARFTKTIPNWIIKTDM